MTLNAKAALLKKLGYTASELIKHLNSDPTAIKDKVKKMVMDQFQNRVATLVASYTAGNSAASGDAKSYGEDNMLTSVITNRNYKNSADFTYYVLFNRQFKIIADNGSDTPAGKALLKVPTSLVKSGAMARSLTNTKGDGETTGIIDVEGVKEVNGVKDDSWYTVNGVKLDGQPTKPGIYIYNGKKVKK